jgi:outer membrane protein
MDVDERECPLPMLPYTVDAPTMAAVQLRHYPLRFLLLILLGMSGPAASAQLTGDVSKPAFQVPQELPTHSSQPAAQLAAWPATPTPMAAAPPVLLEDAQLPTVLVAPYLSQQSGDTATGQTGPADAWVPPYHGQPAPETQTTAVPPPPGLPEPYWLSELVRSRQDAAQFQLWLDFDQAIWEALEHSPFIKATLTLPLQAQARIQEETGIFDPVPFVDSVFKDTSDPVGNTLTTGGPLRLQEMTIDSGAGVRARNQLGGSAELSQDVLLRNNNSLFFTPKNQADTRMTLRLNQPLMRGAGRSIATASLRIAEFNSEVSQHEAMRKLQLHARAVARAYWELYAARSLALQSQRGKERLVYLRDQLSARADLDGLRSQLLRAEAAVQRQEAALRRAEAQTITAEAQLRALINSPTLRENYVQIIPRTPPLDQRLEINRVSEVEAALAFHPEVLAHRDRIKAATTRMKVAENELRPTLNLVVESYIRGLNGEFGVTDSFGDQFARGRPSLSSGLNYQRPYRNTAANAILRERRLEIRQLLYELDHTLVTVTADVEQAIQEVAASFADLEASVGATLAYDAEVRYLEGRLRSAFVDGSQPSLLLDELLNAQSQLIQAENAWALAEAEHMKAFVNLQVATGALLSTVQVNLPD